MRTLWKKEGVDTDEEILAFTIGDDQILDNFLIRYDLVGTLAHARGLEKIGLLDARESADIRDALSALFDEWTAGDFRLGAEDEDVHSAIERRLVDMLGDAGKKIHAGRSRNDQVLTALRLFMKHELLQVMEQLADVAGALCAEGRRYADLLMPGYTHMQRAMPSTVAFWYASFAESFADSLESGQALFDRLDRSPLGAAAGYGVPLPLDREHTARLMGFGRVHVNAGAVQNSRGRLESALLNWLVEIGRDIEKMAVDLLLFSSAEFGFVSIPERLCTGSSIMPQKRNADVLELLRARASVLAASRDAVERIISKLPSAYHRDLQLTKAPLMEGLDRIHAMLAILGKATADLKWHRAKMEGALGPEIFATHRALDLVKDGVPFREAYQQAASELRDGATGSWKLGGKQVIADLCHIGAPGNPGLREAKLRIALSGKWAARTRKALEKRWDALLSRP